MTDNKVIYKASNDRFSVYFETLEQAKVFLSQYKEATIEEIELDVDQDITNKVFQIWRGS